MLELALGGEHSCIIALSGGIRCWGNGGRGRLGYVGTDNVGDDEVPATAGDVNVGGESGFRLAPGRESTCAWLFPSKIHCWGYNNFGALGYGHTHDIGDNEAPASAGSASLEGPGDTINRLAGGGLHHSCVVYVSGRVRCWGYAAFGALGYGNGPDAHIGDDETPLSAGYVDVGAEVSRLSLGGPHSCALLKNGAVRCWGLGTLGRLGYANTATVGLYDLPASAGDVDVGGAVDELASGYSHTCALLVSGVVRCWGWGAYGTLGYGNENDIGDDETPASAGDVDVGGPVVQLVAGTRHTCALLAGGTVRCWGLGHDGRLGYGHTESIGDDETPASAGDVDVGAEVNRLAAGGAHTCALLTSGKVRCWGDNLYGQLGYGHTRIIGDDETPASAGDVPLF